ncbi:MAG: helix-turn-helix transcriptional regulator [Parvularculaceae bacterium]|nr:helix-turn-helix transcriptional regulator [Parvularculaceae bacterium]
MLLFDLMVRFGALSLLLFLAVITASRVRQTRKGRLQAILLTACSLSFCGPLIIAIPPPHEPSPVVLGAAKLVASPNIALSFLFGLAVFTDGFRWRTWHSMLLAAVTVLSFISRLPVSATWGVWDQRLSISMALISAGLMIYLLATVIRGTADDLLKSRRQVRLVFTIGAVLTAGSSLGAEWILPELAKNTWQAFLGVVFAVAVLAWLTRFQQSSLVFENRPAVVETPLDPGFEQLEEALKRDQIYLEPGLTVADLGQRLGIQPHEVRRLISEGSAYRNFSAFINTHRIEHAKARLTDEAQDGIPILTIALESGFSSITPFNRAFRDVVGMTPSAFRREGRSKNLRDL